MTNALKRESIIPRIDGVMLDLDKLRALAAKGLEKFKKDEDVFALSKFYLRQALEGVFHIGEHILSRLNGGRSTEYKDIARLLGERGVIDRDFANTNLTYMAGYRNRLTHFYYDVKPEEIYKILTDELGDFDAFLRAVKKVLEHPEKFGLKVE